MTNLPESNSNNPVADQNSDGIHQNQTKLDFGIWLETWLEKELKCLEERYESFATTKSNRSYFSR